MASVAVNLPLKGLAVSANRDVLATLVEAGVEEVWTDELNGSDAIAALAAFAAWQPEIRITSAIVNVYTRSPGLLAMAAATLSDLASGRTTFGIGASSPVVVEQWNGIPYREPLARVGATLRFLRQALTEGRADSDYLGVDGFRLGVPPSVPPRLAVGALGPRMQRLAAAEADTMVTGMVAPTDLRRLRANIAGVERLVDTDLEIHVGVFVLPSDLEEVDQIARRHLGAYLPVPAYSAFETWLGRGGLLAPMLERWRDGDRRGAVDALPSEVVGELVVIGDPDECAATIAGFFDEGASGVNLMIPAAAQLSAPRQVTLLTSIVKALRDHIGHVASPARPSLGDGSRREHE